MTLHTFYYWINTTALSQYLQNSTYTFPVTEVIHLIGLAFLLGATFVVCMRLLGFGLSQPASTLYSGMAGWTWFGLVLVLGTGVILLVAEPTKMADNIAFAYKLGFLGAALVLHFFAHLFLLKPGRAEAWPLLSKVTAILVMGCWLGAGIAGRAIGFV